MGLMAPMMWNPSPVRIRRLISTPDDADPTFGRAPSKKRYGPVETIYAQLYSFTEERRIAVRTGDMGKTSGYLLMKVPATEEEWLKPGDLVVGMPNKQDASRDEDFRSVSFMIVERPNPQGHLPGPTLLRCYYTENLDQVAGKREN
jgi:hypothetical protein